MTQRVVNVIYCLSPILNAKYLIVLLWDAMIKLFKDKFMVGTVIAYEKINEMTYGL